MDEKNLALSANLIGLRGGLSLISTYTDEIHKCHKSDEMANLKTKQAYQKLSDTRAAKAKIETNIKSLEFQCEQIKSEIGRIEKMSNKEVARRYNGPERPRYKAWDQKVFQALCVLSFFVILIIMMYTWAWSIAGVLLGIIEGLMFAAVPSAILTVLLGCPIKFIAKCIKYSNETKKHKIYILENKTRILKGKISDLEETQEELEVIKVEEEYAQKSYQAQILNENDTNKRNAEAVKMWAEKSMQVKDILLTNYGVVIMECDWENIDLILHYIETGRADSLKEALQLVDKQRQVDQLENAIKSAARSVSMHIESAFERMGSALSVCFARLSMNIKGISDQIGKSQQITNAANRALLERLDKQISATEIQNALLEKSNKSSEELLNDLRYNQEFWRK